MKKAEPKDILCVLSRFLTAAAAPRLIALIITVLGFIYFVQMRRLRTSIEGSNIKVQEWSKRQAVDCVILCPGCLWPLG